MVYFITQEITRKQMKNLLNALQSTFQTVFREQASKNCKNVINFLNGGIAENNEAVSRYSLKP
jgi:hypothetical protein